MAPSRANAAAIASPLPEPAPVTIAMRPAKRRLVAAAGAAAAATAAAAFGLEVGIGDREAAAHQAVDVIDLGALDVLGTQRVDQNAHAVELEGVVVIAGLVV